MKTLKEKEKDILSVIIILLVILMWATMGFELPKSYLAVEVILGCVLIGIVSLMHRK